MFRSRRLLVLFTYVLIVLLMGCDAMVERTRPVEIAAYPIESLDGLVSTLGVAFDSAVTSDGGQGSLRITTSEPRLVNLYETGDIDVEQARLIYRASLRTENVEGEVYLEMWCVFKDGREFFSRAQHVPLSGTNDWTLQETPFFLKKGENPSNVKLNLIIDGKGTVWIDDIRLLKAMLEQG